MNILDSQWTEVNNASTSKTINVFLNTLISLHQDKKIDDRSAIKKMESLLTLVQEFEMPLIYFEHIQYAIDHQWLNKKTIKGNDAILYWLSTQYKNTDNQKEQAKLKEQIRESKCSRKCMNAIPIEAWRYWLTDSTENIIFVRNIFFMLLNHVEKKYGFACHRHNTRLVDDMVTDHERRNMESCNYLSKSFSSSGTICARQW